MEEKEKNILEKMNNTLSKILGYIDADDLLRESERLRQKTDRRVEYSLKQIQRSFDRIHDKLFRLNNILIGIYIVLGTYPTEDPKLSLWTVLFPLMNLIYFIWLEYKQLNIYRFASNELDWRKEEMKQYGIKINKQNLLSFLSIISTLCVILFLIFRI